MKWLNKISVFVLLATTTLFCAYESPTEKYVQTYSMEDIKYHLRLDHVTLIYKDLFDKLILKETEGFVGYHGSSVEYRVYQDVIRYVIQELVGIPVRDDFHFLSIPCFYEQNIQQLSDIPSYFLPEKSNIASIENQLFPLTISIYSNHNRIGFSSISHFTKNSSKTPEKKRTADLEKFLDTLGIPPELAQEAMSMGRELLREEQGILIQIYDTSDYAFVNKHCYPAYPNGYPFANRSISEYILHEEPNQYPHEVLLVLTDKHTLNPHSSLQIQRYEKRQPSIIKQYESRLLDKIKTTSYDEDKVEAYRQSLLQAWGE